MPHNKLDLVIWNWETKVCTIVEFSCPLDITAIKKVSEKLKAYLPIVVGAMGYVPKCLVTYLEVVGFEGKEIKPLIRRMQVKSISGSVKICKTFLNFNDFKK